MNESISGVVLGILAFVGLSYVAVKVRQNQRRLHRLVGVIDGGHAAEIQCLLAMADSGDIAMYTPPSSR